MNNLILTDQEILFIKTLCTIERNNLNNYLLINKYRSSNDLKIKNCILNIELIQSVLNKLNDL